MPWFVEFSLMARALQALTPMSISAPRRALAQLHAEWESARLHHPRLLVAVTSVFALLAAVSLTGSIWFLSSVTVGLPDRDAMVRIGDMDESTTVFDSTDRMVFTIYKEQRID